jgi:flagellar protein FliS
LSGDISTKGRSIGRSVRILEEGLKASLDVDRGGELAKNLQNVYDFCIIRMTEANLRNSADFVDEVIRVIHPIADGWHQIKNQPSVQAYHS